MVGSADFTDKDIDGQVNVALAPRQPGSSIKPIFYAGAFEKGWTPATLIWDVPVTINLPDQPPYRPRNFSRRFSGPVTVRHALANSLNVPAVRMVQFLGVDAAIEVAQRLGLTTFADRSRFGPSIVLGGGEVKLLDMVGAYSIFARGGTRLPLTVLRSVRDSQGNVLDEFQPDTGERVLDSRIAYQITSILADNEARTPGFGPNSPLKLSRPAAAKTGTTDDNKDGSVDSRLHSATGGWCLGGQCRRCPHARPDRTPRRSAHLA